MRKAVEAFKFGPPFSLLDFQVELQHDDGVHVFVRVSAAFAERESGDLRRARFTKRLAYGELDRPALLASLREVLRSFILHELDESIVVDGARVFDPHAPGSSAADIAALQAQLELLASSSPFANPKVMAMTCEAKLLPKEELEEALEPLSADAESRVCGHIAALRERITTLEARGRPPTLKEVFGTLDGFLAHARSAARFHGNKEMAKASLLELVVKHVPETEMHRAVGDVELLSADGPAASQPPLAPAQGVAEALGTIENALLAVGNGLVSGRLKAAYAKDALAALRTLHTGVSPISPVLGGRVDSDQPTTTPAPPVTAHEPLGPAQCSVCGKPATCWARREGEARPADLACDECCGGHSTGECERIATTPASPTPTQADDEATRLHNSRWDQLATLRKLAATCATPGCGKPAACWGAYEDPYSPWAPACNDCCGLGNEDGHCERIEATPTQPALVEAVGRVLPALAHVEHVADGRVAQARANLLDAITSLRAAYDAAKGGAAPRETRDKAREPHPADTTPIAPPPQRLRTMTPLPAVPALNAEPTAPEVVWEAPGSIRVVGPRGAEHAEARGRDGEWYELNVGPWPYLLARALAEALRAPAAEIRAYPRLVDSVRSALGHLRASPTGRVGEAITMLSEALTGVPHA